MLQHPGGKSTANSYSQWHRLESISRMQLASNVRACLRSGIDPNDPFKYGITILHLAATESSDAFVIRVLVEAGAEVDAVAKSDLWAIRQRHYLLRHLRTRT